MRDENADAFRVCLVLIDLRTGKLVAKRVDRATLTTVSAEPTPLFRDSPTWALDRTAVAYIKSCQGSSPGDSVDPAYLLRLPASAIVAEAQAAFAENKPAEAYRLFREAQPLADADDLRILNGLYLTGLAHRQEEGSDRDLRPDRRHRPRQQEAADQDLLQPRPDHAARLGRPAGAVRGLAARGGVPGRACARPA